MSSYLPSWESVQRAVTSIYGIARDINPATLTGAIDVIVVQRKDGTLACSPFHVRFGKLKLLVPSEKNVDVIVNGTKQNLPMKVGDAGEAFFVVETKNPVPKEYATSPLASAADAPLSVEPLSLDDSNVDDGSAVDTPVTFEASPTPPDDVPEAATDAAGGESAVDQSVAEKLFDDAPEPGQLEQRAERDRYPLSDTEMDRLRPDARADTRNMLSDTEPEATVGSPPKYTWTWGALPTKAAADPSQPSDTAGSQPSEGQTEDLTIEIASTAQLSPVSAPRDESGDLDGSGARNERSPSPSLPGSPSPASNEYEDSEYPSLGDFKVDISLCGQPDNLPKLSKEEAALLFRKNSISFDEFCQNPSVLTDPNLVLRINGSYYSWSVAAPMIACRAIYGYDLPGDVLSELVAQHQKKAAVSGWRQWWSRSSAQPPAPPARTSTSESSPPMSPPVSAPPSPTAASLAVPGPPKEPAREEEYNYAKTLRLTSDQLKELNLQKGLNTVSFVVRSTLQGTAATNARIFLLDEDTKIVISDVDGTITKSDALGHLFTMVGRDWTHSGVAGLYTAIKNNGYQLLYLTSRAIGQASYTRDYLKKVEQGQFQLPDGPVIMSPDRLFKSFHREVILKKPEEFKMAVLRDIKRLFGDTTPFYAGFGNRITDALSYRSVGIPSSRIFTIDPAGDVKLELMPTYKSTYLSLNELAEYLFPPINRGVLANEEEAFSDLNYWKQPLPEIDDILDLNGEDGDGDYFDEEQDLEASGVDLV
ncbi:lipin 3, isoform CRA_b [Hyaloraphidium curvatum]|nr:lipin 3, isoform CRA_b [Hyaloraphidium curvatum]